MNIVERQSVQEHEPKESLGYTAFFDFSSPNAGDEVLLSEYGSHKRDRELRDLYRNQFNWLGQSAVTAIVHKVAQVPWQLQGGRNLTTHYQSILQEADFGDGWSDFVGKVLLDYLTCDYGAYIEIIGAGRADKPLRGRVLGIAHLDSLRCVPTGNLEYPVVYWSRKTGKMHRLHHTRVYRLVDMKDGDESRFGVGLCALSRAIALLQQMLNLMKYTNGQLADVPATGLYWLPPGITTEQFQDTMKQYKERRESTGYKGVVGIGSPSTASGGKGEYVPFSTSPDGFDYEMYIDIAVNAFAAAFGIDRQDIFPLQGKMSGTATQSEVLFEKAKGMTFGDILSRLKRMMNTAILPPSLEYDHEYRDEEKDLQVAQRTGTLLDNATKMRGVGYSDEQIHQYLANQDENLRDVTLNEAGEIISLPDDDVLEPEQTDTETIETDTTNDTSPNDNVTDDDESQKVFGDTSIKTIATTQSAFMQRFDDVFKEARAGNINRRRAGLLIRGMIRTFGGRAYGDGLEEGDVPRDQMDAQDNAKIASLVAENSKYVSNLTDVLYNQNGVTDAQADAKAVMWFNKTITPFFDAGRRSAFGNKMYRWELGATEEHCEDCSYFNGQVHRLRVFLDSGWHPKSSKLSCKGFRCECLLKPAPNAKATGVMKKEHTHICKVA